jgi:ADP-ribose pyrophosphatase
MEVTASDWESGTLTQRARRNASGGKTRALKFEGCGTWGLRVMMLRTFFIGGRSVAKQVKGKRKERLLKRTVIYEGPIFGLRRDELIEPGGLRTTREVITHPGSVVVLPVLADGRIVMIQQYRHAARQYMWELVAGRMDGGESPKKGGARELLEETGYRAKHWKVFLEVFPTPGFLEEKLYIMLARGLTAGVAQPEADEKIISRAYRVNEVKQMMQNGKLIDAKSIAGILYYLTFLQ